MTLPCHAMMPVIRAALARRQRVRMTAKGTSMWPLIHDGDVIELAPPEAAPVRGDIVLAEPVPERYVVHRVVRVHSENIWLRGDAQTHCEGPIALHDVLGIVTSTMHAGHNRVLNHGAWRLAGIACMHCAPLVSRLCGLKTWVRTNGARVLRSLHRTALIRAALHRFRPAFDVHEATPEELALVNARLDHHTARDVSAAPTPASPGLTNYVAMRGTEFLGFVRLMRHPAGDDPHSGHWLYSLVVRTRYRGMGIGERLVERVIDQATADGARELLLTVFENNRPARALYKKLGFELVTIPALDAELADDVKLYGRQRIPLRKRLS